MPDFLITSETALSRRDFFRAVGGASDWLHRQGVICGERVALMLPPGPELLSLLFGCWRLGAIACLPSTRLPAAAVDTFLAEVGCSRRIIEYTLTLGSEWQLSLPDEQQVTLLWTSGSGASPKAAVHTWDNFVSNARGSNANIVLGPGDRWLLALPLYHVGGLSIVVRCLLAGAALVLPGAEQKAPPTHVSMVATQFLRMENAEKQNYKAILLGGSALPRLLIERAYRTGLPIHTSYGMTEMASQIATTPPGADLEALCSSGKVLPEREVKVSNTGEILVKGKPLFQGYWDPQGLRRPLDEEGWFATGDLGYFDARGYLHITGRKDNMFISGGENIQPEEIEQVLLRFLGVIQVMVVPRVDPEFGQRPVAFIEGFYQEGALKNYLAERLPKFKHPVAFYPWPEVLLISGIKPRRADFLKLV